MAAAKKTVPAKITADITTFINEHGAITYKAVVNDEQKTVLVPPDTTSFKSKQAAFNYACKHVQSHVDALREQNFEPESVTVSF